MTPTHLLPERATCTIEEAARVLGISRNLGYEMARQGRIPTIKLGRRQVVPVAGLERLLSGEPPPAA